MNKFIHIILLIAVVALAGCSSERMNYYIARNESAVVREIPTWASKYFIVDKTPSSYIFKFGSLDCNGALETYNSISFEELQNAIADKHNWKTVKVDDTIEITSPVIWRVDNDEIIYYENNRFKWIYENDAGDLYGQAELCNLEEYQIRAKPLERIVEKTVYITNQVDIITNENNSGNTVQSVDRPTDDMLGTIEQYRTIDFNFHDQ